MSLKEFIEAAGRYLAKIISEKFCGKVVITLNFNQGGIGNVHVSTEHQLQKCD